MLDIARKLSNQIFSSFRTIFTDLDLAWESQGQHEAKPIGLIFSHDFHLIRKKFLTNFSIDLVEMQHVATTCWFVEAHAKFVLHQ